MDMLKKYRRKRPRYLFTVTFKDKTGKRVKDVLKTIRGETTYSKADAFVRKYVDNLVMNGNKVESVTRCVLR